MNLYFFQIFLVNFIFYLFRLLTIFILYEPTPNRWHKKSPESSIFLLVSGDSYSHLCFILLFLQLAVPYERIAI